MSMGSGLANGWQSFAVAGPTEDEANGQRPAPSWQGLKTALLAGAATSVIAYPAGAQQAAEPVPLPPLNVEAAAKKKAPAKKAAAKKAAPTQAVSPAPQPPSAQAAQQPDPLPGQAAPAAPGVYNAQYSTSPKITGPLLDTPQTVTVVPTAIIQERKSTTLLETLKNTPGITIDAGENGFVTGGLQFAIRGFNSTGNVFTDGVRDNGIYSRDTFNVEQVEIFKGPAADNGRGSAGGYVNIVTKTPKLEDFVEAQVGFGFDEYDSETRRRASFDVNESAGSVAARLNFFIQDGGVAGRDVAEANAWGAAPSLAFGLGTETRAIFSYERYERHDLPDAGVRVNRAPPVNGVAIDSAGPRPSAGTLPRDAYFGFATNFDDTVADTFVARFEHDLAPGVTVTNQTRWAQIEREANLATHQSNPAANQPGPFGGMNAAPFAYDRSNESLSNQTNLAARFYTGQFKHTISTGVEFTREESFSRRASNQTVDIGIDTAAVYAYDTVDLDRYWQVVGGLRLEHYQLDLAGDGIPGIAGTSYSQNDTTLGGKIGVIYKPVDNASLYGSYGISHLPHGSLLSNPDISRADGDAYPGFAAGADTLEFHNYEVGAKWDFFDGRLSTTAALFRTEKKNAPHTTRVSNTIFYEEQVVQGLELGIAGNLTDRWKAFGGLLWMHSDRKHSQAFDDEQCPDREGDYGLPNNADCTGQTTNGNELAFTPKFSATFWTTYDVTNDFTVGGGVQYVGESWVGRTDDALRIIKNGVYGKLPDYFLVNLYASYDVTDNLELSLNVDNVFDELYLSSMNWGGNWGYIGPPRTYWLNASVKY